MALLTEFPFEILLADDASCRKVREENRVLNRLDGCRVLELETTSVRHLSAIIWVNRRVILICFFWIRTQVR